MEEEGPPRDGSSPDRAIIVQDVAEEYAWLARHWPGFRLVMQRLSGNGEKRFDVLTMSSEDGDLRQVYFDVSARFR